MEQPLGGQPYPAPDMRPMAIPADGVFVPTPSSGMQYPPPNRAERRIDPADGIAHYFDDACIKLQARGLDPVAYWYEKMGVVQLANISLVQQMP